MIAKTKDYEKLLKIVSIKRAKLEPALAQKLRQRSQILDEIAAIDRFAAVAGTQREQAETLLFDPLEILNHEKWCIQQNRKKDALLQELTDLDIEVSRLRGLLLENFRQDQHLIKMIKRSLQESANMRFACANEA